EHLDIGALGFVVLGNALVEAIHEDGHGGDGQTAKSTDNTGLGNAGSQIAGQNGSFVGVEDLTSHVGDGGVIVIVHDRELDIGIGFSGSLGGIADQETNGHDQITFFFDEGVEVLFVISNFFGLEVFTFNAELFLGVSNALPGSRVEGFVVNTTGIGDLANQRCFFYRNYGFSK